MERIPVIDISVHNTRRGRIDFQRVYASGVRGIMISIGWAGYEGEIVEDKSLEDSVIRTAAGLGVELYVYSCCTSEQTAKKAAQKAVETARRYVGKITYPIAFDVEETQNAALINLGREQSTDTVIAFVSKCNGLVITPCGTPIRILFRLTSMPTDSSRLTCGLQTIVQQ